MFYRFYNTKLTPYTTGVVITAPWQSPSLSSLEREGDTGGEFFGVDSSLIFFISRYDITFEICYKIHEGFQEGELFDRRSYLFIFAR